jgi:hypothetical protein
MVDIQTPLTGDDGHSGANPISLAHVLALSVPVHWTESVAVIEELCLVLGVDGDTALVPDAQDILITAQGAVLVQRGAPGLADVDALGRLLNALLDPVTTPIPLRLFVAHSIGSEKYRSVSAYGDALAYYARPDRRELIQAVYQRCLESSNTVSPVLSEPPRVEATPPASVPETPLVTPRRVPRWVPLAVVVLLVAMGSYFVASRRFTGGFDSVVAAAPVHTLTTAAAKVVQTVREFITAPPEEPQAVGPVEAGAATPVRSRQTQRAPATSRAVLSAGQTPVASSADPESTASTGGTGSAANAAWSTAPPQVLVPLDSQSLSEGALALPPVAVNTPERTVFVDQTVYTSASPDVQPPVMYSPKLPPMPPTTPDVLGTNTMSLLIDEGGAVQQALLTSPPVRMSDMLLLSAAKVWKFHPATKDGRPVKYRLTVSWTVAPP